MNKMCGRFPGSIVIWVTYPFDKVFSMVMSLMVVKDAFDFEFLMVLNGDWGWWR
jgi:hypothetical protein